MGASEIRALLRPHLEDVEPYVTARSRFLGGVLLDANENPHGSPVPETGADLHRYPDPANAELRAALAERAGVPPAAIWVGNGSDEAIDLLVRLLVSPGERVVVAAPSYGVYRARAELHAAEVVAAPLDAGWDLDVERTAELAADAKLVFLCSPNNPTGNPLTADWILELVERCPALVAVDEAYGEFSEAPSLAPRTADVPRLAVLRTFSKAWGLAGARVGWLAGDPELVAHLRRAGLPYPLSKLSARAALAALQRKDEVRGRLDRILRERGRVRERLEALGLTVAPSDANFLLFFVADPAAVQRRLAEEHGVVIRDRSGLAGLAGALRVTIGTREENDRFLSGLEDVLDRC